MRQLVVQLFQLVAAQDDHRDVDHMARGKGDYIHTYFQHTIKLKRKTKTLSLWEELVCGNADLRHFKEKA